MLAHVCRPASPLWPLLPDLRPPWPLFLCAGRVQEPPTSLLALLQALPALAQHQAVVPFVVRAIQPLLGPGEDCGNGPCLLIASLLVCVYSLSLSMDRAHTPVCGAIAWSLLSCLASGLLNACVHCAKIRLRWCPAILTVTCCSTECQLWALPPSPTPAHPFAAAPELLQAVALRLLCLLWQRSGRGYQHLRTAILGGWLCRLCLFPSLHRKVWHPLGRCITLDSEC